MKIYFLIPFLFLPSICHAFCLKNCQQETVNLATDFPNIQYNGVPPYRGGNITTSDVKNSVFGDMNIRIGHERLDIKTDSNSSNNTIDASINSTIILGDMNK